LSVSEFCSLSSQHFVTQSSQDYLRGFRCFRLTRYAKLNVNFNYLGALQYIDNMASIVTGISVT